MTIITRSVGRQADKWSLYQKKKNIGTSRHEARYNIFFDLMKKSTLFKKKGRVRKREMYVINAYIFQTRCQLSPFPFTMQDYYYAIGKEKREKTLSFCLLHLQWTLSRWTIQELHLRERVTKNPFKRIPKLHSFIITTKCIPYFPLNDEHSHSCKREFRFWLHSFHIRPYVCTYAHMIICRSPKKGL